jgi:hypothetical protein
MVHRAFVDVDGRRRWSWYERVWDTLVGVDGWTRDIWEQRHDAVVRELKDVFALWMERVPLDGRRLGGFAAWLASPAATSLRLTALPWLGERVVVDKERELRDVKDAEDAIAMLLNVVWSEQETALRTTEPAFQAFRRLLAWLGDRQNPLGLEMLGRMGRLW